MSRRATAELTGPQIAAAVQALDHFLAAGTYEECLDFFGSAPAVAAAGRAHDELVRAGNRVGAFASPRRRR